MHQSRYGGVESYRGAGQARLLGDSTGRGSRAPETWEMWKLALADCFGGAASVVARSAGATAGAGGDQGSGARSMPLSL
eukprot:scaffold19304_cov33-Tisochrysis_lutea.AAC.1